MCKGFGAPNFPLYPNYLITFVQIVKGLNLLLISVGRKRYYSSIICI